MKRPIIKDSTTTYLVQVILILSGAMIVALSLNIFVVPYKIAPGGITGLATIIFHISGKKFPLGIIMLMLNLPLFILVLRLEGKVFILKTLFATVSLSIFTDISAPFVNRVIIPALTKEMMNDSGDLLINCLIGGLLLGIGLGLTVKAGSTTGGTDLAAVLLKKFLPRVSFGKLLFLIDCTVVILAMTVFQSVRLGLYAIITLIAQTQVIDTIQEGVDYSKAIYIISDHFEKISERVMNEMDRGATALYGTGMYSGTEKRVLLVVVTGKQISQAVRIIKEVDSSAFVIINDVREILGEGFKNIN